MRSNILANNCDEGCNLRQVLLKQPAPLSMLRFFQAVECSRYQH